MKECCKTYLAVQFGGDDDIANEIYGEYVSSVREKLAEADTALAGGDWTLLDRVAHTIKGNALSTGDNEMAQIAIDLRGVAHLQDNAQAAALIAQLKTLAELL